MFYHLGFEAAQSFFFGMYTYGICTSSPKLNGIALLVENLKAENL